MRSDEGSCVTQEKQEGNGKENRRESKRPCLEVHLSLGKGGNLGCGIVLSPYSDAVLSPPKIRSGAKIG